MRARFQSKFRKKNSFVLVVTLLVIIAGLVFNQPTIAMWFGFLMAGYSAVANDSIQTLGTFLSSNRKVSWKILWMYIGGIMLATVYFGWLTNSGDISYGRLNKIPQPADFTFIELLAPIILIVLTQYRMPVSTTFLILATFSSVDTIHGMLNKTLFGYILAFVVAIVVWGTFGYYTSRKHRKIERDMTVKEEKRWRTLQWLSTGFLWSAWLAQDNANAAVFLPRQLSGIQLIFAMLFMLLALGFILFRRGGGIQTIVTEKTDVIYVKSATVIDFIYALILVYFKWLNDLPMSTTWVFLGMLAGREIALRATLHREKPYGETLKLVRKDLLRAGFGLGVSLALAIMVNTNF
jgi:hypothetical protein